MAIYALENKSPVLPAGLCFVAENASVIGNVELGEEASVWFGAVLRGDNELIRVGAGSNIQDLSVLHTDEGFPLTIGEGCTIGHRATLHGCTIGDHSLVGMGATVLNGARIGRHCLVGAGALITEGREFPEGSLIIGVPAKPARALDAEEIDRLRRSADHYRKNARRFSLWLRTLV